MTNFQEIIMNQVHKLLMPNEKYEEYTKDASKKKQAKIHLADGQMHLQSKEYNQAINCGKDALTAMRYGKRDRKFTAHEIDTRVLPALLLLAQTNFEMQQYNKTLFYCDQILALRPNHKKTKFLQSTANLQKGSFSAALKFYKQ
mmetsp:Transcript_453/g.494  ORF Transcript_453/g.494 Transcript_453/m.494 type:complete len:144 (+) Transcript_453:206-637(+)